MRVPRGFAILLALGLCAAGARPARADFHASTTVTLVTDGEVTHEDVVESTTIYGRAADYVGSIANLGVAVGSLVASFYGGGPAAQGVWETIKGYATQAGVAYTCYRGARDQDLRDLASCYASVNAKAQLSQAIAVYDVAQAIRGVWGAFSDGEDHEARTVTVPLPAPPDLPDEVIVTFEVWVTKDRDLLGEWDPIGAIKHYLPVLPGQLADHPAIAVEGPTFTEHYSVGWFSDYGEYFETGQLPVRGFVRVTLRPHLMPLGEFGIVFSGEEDEAYTTFDTFSIEHTVKIVSEPNRCAAEGKYEHDDGQCYACPHNQFLDLHQDACWSCPVGSAPDYDDLRPSTCQPCTGATVVRGGECVTCADGHAPNADHTACVRSKCDLSHLRGGASQLVGAGTTYHGCTCTDQASNWGTYTDWTCQCAPDEQRFGGVCRTCPRGQAGVPMTEEHFNHDTACAPVVGKVAPIGGLVTASSCDRIAGWAQDLDRGAQAVSVEVWDGPRDQAWPAVRRLATLSGRGISLHDFVGDGDGSAPQHTPGFEYRLPAELRGGPRPVYVYVIDDTYRSWDLALGPTYVGCGAERAPLGQVDPIGRDGLVTGWAVDPDSYLYPVNVQFWLDGPPGVGALLGSTFAQRADTRATRLEGWPGAHGFAWQIPARYRDGALHQLYVVADDRTSYNHPTAARVLGGGPREVWMPAPAPRPRDVGVRTGDFDGDGRDDLLWVARGGRTYLRHATATGLGAVVEPPNSGAWGPRAALVTGDFDGDGRTDLLSLQADGRSFVQLGQPGGNLGAPTETWQSDQWGEGATVHTGDFDGDGRTDLLWLQADGRSFVQRAQAGGTFASYVETWQSDQWGEGATVHPGDFDGDGRTDLLWLQADGRSFVQLAQPGGTFASYVETWQSGQGGDRATLHTGDFDGDERTDLLWLQADGRSFVQLARPGGTFASYVETWQSDQWGEGATLHTGDFDGNGRTDLLWLQADGRSFVQLAQPGGTFASYVETAQSDTWGESPRLTLGDLDGDGRTDLVWALAVGGLRAQLATSAGFAAAIEPGAAGWAAAPSGARTFWDAGYFDLSRCASRIVDGDFDGDGAQDQACLYDLGPGWTDLYVWSSTGTGFAYRTAWSAPGWFHAAACGDRFVAGDFSGDGRDDLACGYDLGGGYGDLYVWTSNGATAPFGYATVFSAPGWFDMNTCGERFVAGDFAGDGKADLACGADLGGGHGDIYLWTSTGTTSAWGYSTVFSAPGWFNMNTCGDRFVVGDFAGDAKDDLVCGADLGSGHGDIYLWTSNATPHGWGYSTVFSAPGWFDMRTCRGRFVVGDFAGGAKDDLACGADLGGGYADIYVWTSNGSPHGWGYATAYSALGWFHMPRCEGRFVAADVGGTRKDDLVCGYDLGGGQADLYAWLSNGTGAAWAYRTAWSSGASGGFDVTGCVDAGFAAGDFDGRGRDDVACAQTRGGTATRHTVWSIP